MTEIDDILGFAVQERGVEEKLDSHLLSGILVLSKLDLCLSAFSESSGELVSIYLLWHLYIINYYQY